MPWASQVRARNLLLILGTFFLASIEMESAMSDYERRRAENIARNAEMLAKLGLHESARKIQLAKPAREKKPKGYKPAQKRSRDEPVVLRRSLRTKGISPDTTFKEVLEQEMNRDSKTEHSKKKDSEFDDSMWENVVPFSKFHAADQPADDSFRARILEAVEDQPILDLVSRSPEQDLKKIQKGFTPSHFKLDGKDVARVVPERIFSLMLLPVREKAVVVAGDKAGNVGLWDADYTQDEESLVHVYHPHKSPVAGMAYAPHEFAKIVTCGYDGAILVMDIEKAVFTRIYSASDILTALCYPSEGNSCIYVGEGEGEVIALDPRSNKTSFLQKLHEKRINTIDFNPQRPCLFATSSTDGTVSIWDVRNLGKQSSLATMTHQRAVHSAYFSPSGNQLASTSYDNHVGLWSGIIQKQDEDQMLETSEPVMIYHNNQTNRWISTFRAIWSCSERYVFITNMSRAIDVISTKDRKTTTSLRSEEMTSIPSRLAQHPLVPGVLAGGTAGGKVFLWRG